MSEQVYVVISYWPLLNLEKPEIFEDNQAERLTKFLEDQEECPDVEACVWLGGPDEELVPVFLMQRAQEIYEHLVRWAEDKPEEWFRIYADFVPGDTLNRYAVILYPNIDKSIERFRLANLMFREEIADENAKYQVLYQPLIFSSQPEPATFIRIHDHIDKKGLQLGFLDTKFVDPNHLEHTDFRKVRYIGPLQRDAGPTAHTQTFLEGIVADTK